MSDAKTNTRKIAISAMYNRRVRDGR